MKAVIAVLSVLLIASAGPVAASAETSNAEAAATDAGMFADSLLTGHGQEAASVISSSSASDVTVLPGFPLTWISTLSGPAAAAVTTTVRLEPAIERVRLRPRPKPGPFRMNLYTKGDFMHQQTEYWCVSASTQTMMNIINDGKPNRSAAFQKKLHFEGRALDKEGDAFWRGVTGEAKWKKGLHGLGLTDWAEMLNTNGYGPYEIDRSRSLERAIHKAARSMRRTGKPVGLVIWRGAHAWVMSGFTATADPAFTDDFRVKTVNIQDPWYPFVSSIWGASRPPNSAVPVSALGEDFLRYNRPRRQHPKRDGKFLIIEPQLPPNVRLG